MDNQENVQDLKYHHKNMKGVSIIFLSGFLIKRNFEKLNEILSEINSQEGLKYVLIDYSRLNEIGKQVDRDLVQFQIKLRDNGAQIRNCGLSVAKRRELVSVGTMKEKEVKENLSLALKEIASMKAIDQEKKVA